MLGSFADDPLDVWDDGKACLYTIDAEKPFKRENDSGPLVVQSSENFHQRNRTERDI